jgi:phosphotransferase system enzyme I (PtsI)
MHHASTEITLSGVPLSPGVAVGRACLHRYQRIGCVAGGKTGLQPESRRLEESLDRMIRRLQELARQADARLGPEEAGIFVVYRMVLEDPGLRRRLFEAVEEGGLGAEEAVEAQLELFKAELEAAHSEYLRGRAEDISMLEHGLLDGLRGVVSCLCCKDMPYCDIGRCVLGNDHILVGKELSASLPLEVDDHTRGFLLERGGPNSHALILARALQLPAVGGVRGLPDAIPLTARILINGDTGEVVLNPSEDTLARHSGSAPCASAPRCPVRGA